MTLRTTPLTLRHLLPLAPDGLAQAGVSSAASDRYLGVIEGRCLSRQNGATWQLECVRRLEGGGADSLEVVRINDCSHHTALFGEAVHRAL